MKRRVLFIIIILMSLCGANSMNAQTTYLYKRVMVVKNGVKTAKNDDAHYITITDNSCYDSDENGYQASGKYLNFTKDENNLHCYYGKCHLGYAHYYFSADYSRLNIHASDNIIHVYQREPSGTTTAERRPKPDTSGGYVVIPSQPSINYGGSSDNSSPESSPKNPLMRSKCRDCGGNGNCRVCKGRGHSNMYSKTGATCETCKGSGKCTTCYGSGRI